MLELQNVSFSYSDKRVITDVSLAIPKGSHVALIGESGCGKSTLLKLIYGTYDLDRGVISYCGKPILGPKHKLIPGEDYIKYVAQDFDLMPYITVGENVGKFLSNVFPEQKRQRTNELLELVGMLDFTDVKAKHLSGGQQQRVAIAKALALEPEVLLLDEPFSQIDVFRANTLRRDLFAFLKQKQITCIVATHDSNDVLSFADTVVLLKDGQMVDFGPTQKVYSNPKSYYGASLFGDVNVIAGKYLENNATAAEFVYPHQLVAAEFGIPVVVEKSFYRGSHYLVKAAYEGGILYFNSNVHFAEQTNLSLAIAK